MTSPPLDWRARLEACGLEGSADVPPGLAAQLLRSWHEPLAAEAALREQLEQQPEDKDALRTLLALLHEQGRAAEEVPLRRQLHERRCAQMGVPEAHREAVIAYLEAAETGEHAPERAADAYVTALFDVYAPSFDDSLRGLLAYRAPERLVEAVQAALGDRRGLDVLDLGCGTGLAGPLLRPLARRLEGVDLSPRMLDKARERGVYDALWTGEITATLAASTARYDLLIAVDVLVYFGALEPLFASVPPRLAPGGLFAFTVEKGMVDKGMVDKDMVDKGMVDKGGVDKGYQLRPTARYVHGLDYVRACARSVGLRAVVEREAPLRRQSGQPVPGLVVVLTGD